MKYTLILLLLVAGLIGCSECDLNHHSISKIEIFYRNHHASIRSQQFSVDSWDNAIARMKKLGLTYNDDGKGIMDFGHIEIFDSIQIKNTLCKLENIEITGHPRYETDINVYCRFYDSSSQITMILGFQDENTLQIDRTDYNVNSNLYKYIISLLPWDPRKPPQMPEILTK